MRSTVLATLALALAAGAANAQQAPAAEPAGPKVGDVAPDFTMPGATRWGTLSTPVRLSDYKGQTVVVAFFPKARTSGCTVQMESYRDQYATLFNGGRKVVLIAVSADADTTLRSWARDAEFPFVLASDASGATGTAYGTWMDKNRMDNRYLYVVGPDGRIAYTAKPFKVMAQDAYTELAAAIDKLAPPASATAASHE